MDDDEDDLLFLRDVILDINPALNVVELKNGMEAISYLHEATINDSLPCLTLLDINMPFMDGKRTLEKIRSEKALEHLSVVVLTNSQNPNDKAYFNKLGVEMHTKPLNLSALNTMVRQFLSDHCVQF